MARTTTTVRDVVYAARSTGDLAFDLHLPVGAGPVPLVIYLHGGGWLRGSRTDAEDRRLLPVAAAGFAVAAISYRLSGVATWPAQLEDVRDAVRLIPGLAAQHGAELSGRTTLWGASAGAQVALMAALLPDDETPRADAVVAYFPPTDLTRMSTAPLPEHARRPPFAPQEGPLPEYERLLLGIDDSSSLAEAERRASPVTYASADAPPVLLLHGDEDGMVSPWHTTRLFEALRDAGAPATALYVAGATHEDAVFESPAVLGAVAGHLRDAV